MNRIEQKEKDFQNKVTEIFSNWINGNKKDCLLILLQSKSKIEAMALSNEALYEFLGFDKVNKTGYASSYLDYIKNVFNTI